MTPPNNRSIPELASDAVGQLGKLIGNEFDLARAELSEKAKLAGIGIGLIGGGAVLMIPALVLLLFAAASGLIRAGFSDPVAYLVTGVVAAVIALVLIVVGAGRLSARAMKPTMTLQQLEQDKAAAKEIAR